MTSKRLASSSCARVIPFDLIYEELMSVVGKTIKKCQKIKQLKRCTIFQYKRYTHRNTRNSSMNLYKDTYSYSLTQYLTWYALAIASTTLVSPAIDHSPLINNFLSLLIGFGFNHKGKIRIGLNKQITFNNCINEFDGWPRSSYSKST